MDKVKEKVIEIFEQNGIYIEKNDIDATLEFDSMTFVTLIVDLEAAFNIEFNDDDIGLLSADKERTINGFCKVIRKNMEKMVITENSLLI